MGYRPHTTLPHQTMNTYKLRDWHPLDGPSKAYLEFVVDTPQNRVTITAHNPCLKRTISHVVTTQHARALYREYLRRDYLPD